MKTKFSDGLVSISYRASPLQSVVNYMRIGVLGEFTIMDEHIHEAPLDLREKRPVEIDIREPEEDDKMV